MFWTWVSGFSAALALSCGARGGWWDAAFFAVVSGFCFAARNAFPEDALRDETREWKRARTNLRRVK